MSTPTLRAREELAQTSRRGAILSAIGFVIVALSIGYSVTEINRLTAEKTVLEREIGERLQSLGELKNKISSAQQQEAQLAQQSKALSAEVAQKQQLLERVSHQLGTGQIELAKNWLEQTVTDTPNAVPTTYFQLRSRDQSHLYDRCAATLKGRGITVPKPELVPNKGPKVTEVRYFRSSDAAEANKIGELIKSCVSSSVKVQQIAGYANSPLVRPEQFEVWLAQDAKL